MGYAPDWNKGSMKKSGATPVKHGVTSRELFHGAKTIQKFSDGGVADPFGDLKYQAPVDTGEVNIRGEKVGKYDGNDEIVKYRMKMTDDVGGKSLRLKDQTVAPDFEGSMAEGASKDKLGDFIKDVQSKRSTKNKAEVVDLINTIQANKPKAQAPKAVVKKSPGMGDSFSDDSRSPDQVAEPYRPMHSESEGSYEQLRSPKKEATYKGTNRTRTDRDELSTNLSAKNPELAKKLNMYYGKKK
jgi:hypothetical protein